MPVAAAQCVGLIAGNTAAGLQICQRSQRFEGPTFHHFCVLIFSGFRGDRGVKKARHESSSFCLERL